MLSSSSRITHLCPVFQLAFLLHGERAVDDARRELEAVVDSLDVALRKTGKTNESYGTVQSHLVARPLRTAAMAGSKLN